MPLLKDRKRRPFLFLPREKCRQEIGRIFFFFRQLEYGFSVAVDLEQTMPKINLVKNVRAG